MVLAGKIDNSWPITNGVKLEAYRNTARYITVTGNPLPEFKIGLADIDIHIDETAAELDFEKQLRQDAGKGIAQEPSQEKSAPAINLTGIELERFAEAVEAVPNPNLEWKAWNRLGMSIHRATGGSEFGCRLFHKLSAKSSKYNEKATDARWKQLHRSPPKTITGDTIFWEAHRAKPRWDEQGRRAQQESNENKPGSADDGGHHARQSMDDTISAEDLMHMEFPPVRFIVPGYIVEGLTVLGGKPKAGKSWLAYDICVAVAVGGMAMGAVECEQGDVLYLCLEDNRRRVKNRINVVRPYSDRLGGLERLSIRTRAPRVGEGLYKEFEKWRTGTANPRLIVIDVWIKVRPPRQRGADLYAADYAAAEPLQQYAIEHGLGILILMHTRKMEASDPLESISGTNGITGAANSVLVLTRNAEGSIKSTDAAVT